MEAGRWSDRATGRVTALDPVAATVVDESKELGGALIGAWKLVSFTHLDEAGAEIAGPF